MESNSSGTSPAEAADALNSLTVDRDRLAQRLNVPWALMAAFGAMGAWGVGAAATTHPGAHYEPPVSGWLALLGVLIVAHLVQRESGIQFRAMGGRATWLIAAAFALCLVLFSVSLGLVSLNLTWAVAFPSIVAFGSTTWLSGLAYKAAVEQLRRD